MDIRPLPEWRQNIPFRHALAFNHLYNEKHFLIALLGFSRGAYQVRALAGMIHKVNLSRIALPRNKCFLIFN